MKREVWLDYVRALACLLVALGHLVMSFEEANIITENFFVNFFIKFIYYFHVYVFFFCSGYLFQRSLLNKKGKREKWKYRMCRCVDLAIPYFVFSLITYVIKVVFSDSVNVAEKQTLFSALFKHPVNQMWYLYALVVIVAFVPVICSNRVMYALICFFLITKVGTILLDLGDLTPINYFFSHGIWFVLGMVWSYKRIQLKKINAIALYVGFLVLSTCAILWDLKNPYVTVCLNIVGMISFVEIVRVVFHNKQKLSLGWKFLSKYMFQIYLLHTICAAGIRIILLACGITVWWIHLLFGVVFSFIVPIFLAYIAEKIKVINIVFYPTKVIKEISERVKRD